MFSLVGFFFFLVLFFFVFCFLCVCVCGHKGYLSRMKNTKEVIRDYFLISFLINTSKLKSLVYLRWNIH